MEEARSFGALQQREPGRSGIPGGVSMLESSELRILELWSRGASSDDIAARLDLPHDVVHGTTASILRKLEVSSRIEAVARGLGWGLVPARGTTV